MPLESHAFNVNEFFSVHFNYDQYGIMTILLMVFIRICGGYFNNRFNNSTIFTMHFGFVSCTRIMYNEFILLYTSAAQHVSVRITDLYLYFIDMQI